MGKDTCTEGLCTACPAAMSAASDWMNTSRAGGHEQGILIGLPSAPLTAPSQSPVPVGFTPDWKPRSGVKASIWDRERPAAEVTVALAAATLVEAGAGLATFTGAAVAPFLRAAACAEKVVAATGQPTPAPKRFCNVMEAAVIRASCEATELSVGKLNATTVLLTAWPAAMFAAIS